MRKILTVAWSEFLTAVQSKAFLVGIAVLPILVFTSIAVQKLAGDRADREARKVAVIDRTDQLYPLLSQLAVTWNERQMAPDGHTVTGPRFLMEAAPAGASLDAVKLALSDRVRRKELFAFIELPPELVTGKPKILYYTESATYEALPRWLEQVVGRAAAPMAMNSEP